MLIKQNFDHHAVHLIYPAPLHPGARIAVTAPSSGVLRALHARLDLVLAHLRAQGFEVVEGRCLRDDVASASAGSRCRGSPTWPAAGG